MVLQVQIGPTQNRINQRKNFEHKHTHTYVNKNVLMYLIKS